MSSMPAFAADVEAERELDRGRWRPFVATFLSVPMMSISITRPEDDDSADPLGDDKQRTVDYSPETNPDVGLKADYGPFGLAFSMPIKSPSDDGGARDGPPDSRYWDSKLSYAVWLLNFEAGAYRYQGFSYSADQSLDEANANDPGLVKRGRYANVWFYPMGSDLDIGRRVDEAAHRGLRWSPVAQLCYERTDLESSQAIIPEKYQSNFGRDAAMKEVHVEGYGLAGGATVKFGTSDWQTDFGVTFGRSLDYQEMVMSTQDTQARRRMGEKMSLRFGGDCSLDRWNVGLAMMMDKSSTPLREGTVSSQLGVIQVSAGTQVL